MAVAIARLLGDIEPQRHAQSQVVLGPGHRDIEQTSFLLEFVARPGAEIGGDASIDRVEDEDSLPFLPLGGVDGGEDQIVLILQRDAGLGAGRIRRIQRQLGQEPLARRIAGRDLFELQQITASEFGIFVDATPRSISRNADHPHPQDLTRNWPTETIGRGAWKRGGSEPDVKVFTASPAAKPLRTRCYFWRRQNGQFARGRMVGDPSTVYTST